MPELPEVEVLVRHLAPLLAGRRIRDVEVRRPRMVRPDNPETLRRELRRATLLGVRRRAKFLLFDFRTPHSAEPRTLLGHLGMTGRMFLQPTPQPLPRHTAVLFDLGSDRWVFEDPRCFGRITLDLQPLDGLGPEPFSDAFTPAVLGDALRHTRQPVKVSLLDQRVVAGVGNIYACEALHRARISPRRAANRLRIAEIGRLHAAIREVLATALHSGSTASLSFTGGADVDGFFYYGRAPGAEGDMAERLLVYDREGEPCAACLTAVKRIVQAGRSTYYCPTCQR